LVAPEILEEETLYLEGEELGIIDLGHTDTANSTALYVPSIGLVVSGDAVYNNTHPYLAECDEKARNEWLRALDKIEALHPKAVIAAAPSPRTEGCKIRDVRGHRKQRFWASAGGIHDLESCHARG
jgi:glyoxylase-like metal-dependent hydrolase (beta-lactamase superfamily II)